ncbi:MAG: hypothetical protein P4L40_14560 [Terracidiphilus sp.]|nr:hypothetical protein [Terracidiphilus sp.]
MCKCIWVGMWVCVCVCVCVCACQTRPFSPLAGEWVSGPPTP